MTELRFDGKLVAVTNANSTLGQGVCLELLKRGALVLAISPCPLDFVCKRVSSIEEYQTALESLGKIDALVNCSVPSSNTSISMTSWEEINTALFSLYSLISPTWKIMKNKKHGKIINVESLSSFFSDQNSSKNSVTTYSSLGLFNNLTREGAKYHIKVNTLLYAPFDENFFTLEKILPVILYLIHESCSESGSVIEASGGSVSKIRVQRGGGWFFSGKHQAEDIKEKIKEINNFGKLSDYPVAYSESLLKVIYINYMGKPKI